MSNQAHKIGFISKNLGAARQVRARWGVPVSVLLAQAALESGWGLHVKGNAYFGIKGKAPSGASVHFGTHEYTASGQKVAVTDTFRAYKDFADAADDYGRFLTANKRYAGCFSFSNNAEKFADCLARAGYATDPRYSTLLKAIIRQNNLAQYD